MGGHPVLCDYKPVSMLRVLVMFILGVFTILSQECKGNLNISRIKEIGCLRADIFSHVYFSSLHSKGGNSLIYITLTISDHNHDLCWCCFMPKLWRLLEGMCWWVIPVRKVMIRDCSGKSPPMIKSGDKQQEKESRARRRESVSCLRDVELFWKLPGSFLL